MERQKTTTISEYVKRLNAMLATQNGRIKGEVTSVDARDRVVYFTIKDSDNSAQLNCLIWTWQYQTNGVKLRVGDEIIVTGAPDVYAPIGKLSFKTTTIEYAGEGALKKAYDELKKKLASDGLLAPDNKRPLPKFPKKVGVITSLAGTVIHDFSSNLDKRGYKVSMMDARVEGKDAIHDLLLSIETMSRQDIEVLVIMRGGGSWESLQPFNTESVVRAVAGFKVPVVTGIGHDKDVTLTEMVADIGRSTPTAVAEALNAPWDGLESKIKLLHQRTVLEYGGYLALKHGTLSRLTDSVVSNFRDNLVSTHQQVERHSGRISRALSSISNRVQQADASLQRALGIMRTHLKNTHTYLDSAQRATSRSFRVQLATTRERLNNCLAGSLKQQSGTIRGASQLLKHYEGIIAAHDPRRNIKLGYSLTYADGKLVRSIADIANGAAIVTQLADGRLKSVVRKEK